MWEGQSSQVRRARTTTITWKYKQLLATNFASFLLQRRLILRLNLVMPDKINNKKKSDAH